MKIEESLAEFETIPGVGKRISISFWDIGLRSLSDLVGKDPEQLYEALCDHQNMRVHKCMLYIFRCAVYFVSEKNPKPELLKWWNWKDH